MLFSVKKTCFSQLCSNFVALVKFQSQDEPLVEQDETSKKERSGSEDLEGSELKVEEAVSDMNALFYCLNLYYI